MATTPSPRNPPRRPHFFKVLVAHDFPDRLRIPPAFIKHIQRKQQPRKAKILGPLGRTFEVEIEGDMKNLYFGAGWQQFVLAHDLDFGYFLVFRYEGRLAFHVRVFDITGCEKEYHDGIHRKTAKRTRKSSYIAEEDTERPVTRSSKDKAGKGRMTSPLEGKKTKITSVSRVMAKTAEPANMIAACGNAPGFQIVVTPSSMTRYLHVPNLFRSENKVFRRQIEVVLRDPEGRPWTVGVIHMSRHSHFSKGWKAFAEGNNLKLDDVCTFELLHSKGKLSVFQVHIIRAPMPAAYGAFDPSTAPRTLWRMSSLQQT